MQFVVRLAYVPHLSTAFPACHWEGPPRGVGADPLPDAPGKPVVAAAVTTLLGDPAAAGAAIATYCQACAQQARDYAGCTRYEAVSIAVTAAHLPPLHAAIWNPTNVHYSTGHTVSLSYALLRSQALQVSTFCWVLPTCPALPSLLTGLPACTPLQLLVL